MWGRGVVGGGRGSGRKAGLFFVRVGYIFVDVYFVFRLFYRYVWVVTYSGRFGGFLFYLIFLEILGRRVFEFVL